MRPALPNAWLWCVRSVVDQTQNHTLLPCGQTLTRCTASHAFSALSRFKSCFEAAPNDTSSYQPNSSCWVSGLTNKPHRSDSRIHHLPGNSNFRGISNVRSSSSSTVPGSSQTQPAASELRGSALTYEQKRASTDFSQPVVRVTAGPGSGKTKVLIARVKHLVEKKGMRRERIAVLSFTRKTADELNQRLKADLSRNENPDLDMFIGTFHALASKILE